MDPNETLRQIEEALIALGRNENTQQMRSAVSDLHESCHALRGWLVVRLGFQPDWTKYPVAAGHFVHWQLGLKDEDI